LPLLTTTYNVLPSLLSAGAAFMATLVSPTSPLAAVVEIYVAVPSGAIRAMPSVSPKGFAPVTSKPK
jgi:hypothetical protein